jgi:hypothetical protein
MFKKERRIFVTLIFVKTLSKNKMKFNEQSKDIISLSKVKSKYFS